MARIVKLTLRAHTHPKDDEGLFALAKQHVKEHHPDSTRSEAEIRQLVNHMAQDA
jgi:hypothetical protein